MDKQISEVVKNIAPSATIEIATKAKQMKREGINVISFATGEPDFGTPEHIKKVAVKALDDEFTKYTEVAGIPELRQAIVDKLQRDNNLEYELNQVTVANGAKQALYNAFRTLVNPGDEVVVPSPAYVSFVEQIKLCGGNAVLVPTKEENGFRLTADEIRDRISSKTKAILINSPNNPTGAMYSEKDLLEIGNLAVEKNLWIITDEVYEKICYDNFKHVSIASLDKHFKERTITVNGVSKTYSMTGWRLGYAAGPTNIIKAMTNFQGHVTGNVNSITQKAAAYALTGKQDDIGVMVSEYAKRRDIVVKMLKDIEGVKCSAPDGAFYVFFNIEKLLGRKGGGKVINSDLEFASYILDEAHIALVPGTAFSYPGYQRISFALETELLIEGLSRMKKAVDKMD